jgi:hypothetical protein
MIAITTPIEVRREEDGKFSVVAKDGDNDPRGDATAGVCRECADAGRGRRGDHLLIRLG